MTPKEKAEQLLKKMLSKNPNIQDGISRIDTIQAKLCAIVAVDEILNLVCCMDGKEHWQEYYEKVKIQIENL